MDLYYCYSFRLHRFLNDKGLKYLTKCRHIAKPEVIYWIYKKNELLESALEEYSKFKSENEEV